MVKTLVDEEVVQSSAPAVPSSERTAQATVASKSGVEPKLAAVAEPQVDCYDSCLDLSALFLGRG
ncbi:MAG: hypothetical protein WA672_17170 [Candidatus Angelobacter sp.]